MTVGESLLARQGRVLAAFNSMQRNKTVPDRPKKIDLLTNEKRGFSMPPQKQAARKRSPQFGRAWPMWRQNARSRHGRR